MKDEIHRSYMQRQKTEHPYYDPPDSRGAAIIGVRPGNIGEAIAERLFENASFDTVAGTNEGAHNCSIPDSCLEFFSEAGRVDTLVVCAGETWLDWIEDQPFGQIVEVIHNSLLAPIVVTQVFVRLTMNDPWLKHIVYIGSMAYNRVLNASAPYCAAKAGLAHFSRCMAWELAPKGYRVFTVHPGNVLDTPMTEATIEGIARYRDMQKEHAELYWSSVEPVMGFLSKWEIESLVEQLVTNKYLEHLVGCQIELAGGVR